MLKYKTFEQEQKIVDELVNLFMNNLMIQFTGYVKKIEEELPYDNVISVMKKFKKTIL